MTTVWLEFERAERGRVAEFIEQTAMSIEAGYGAGNCNPDSVAFWTMSKKPKPQEGWDQIVIVLAGGKVSDGALAAAVRSVQDTPSGVIKMFGHDVGTWVLTPGP